MSRPVLGAAPELPGYRWVRPLGAGGFADVHLYEQASPARDVAVKALRVGGDDDGAAALAREADALATVSGHPGVVTLYDSGTTGDGRAFLAMEYCPVTDLADQVRSRPLATARALELMVPVSAAVETLHRAGLVHRDIKPANLMLTRWGQPVLADFGSALPIGAAAADGGGFSLLWAAPEQHRAGTPAHPSADVWALAATTWTLLAGHSPFELPGADNSSAAVAERVRAVRLTPLGRPDVPAELVVTLRSALVSEVADRTRSALEFASQLQAVQSRMGRPRTPALVQVPTASPRAVAARVDDDRTRVRAVPSVEPDPVVASQPGATVLAVDGATDPEITLPPGANVPVPAAEDAPAPGAAPAAAAPVRRGLRPWAVALVVALAVVATAAGVSAWLLGTGGPTPRADTSVVEPRDPVQAPPDPVSGLTGTLTKGRVFWTWEPAVGTGVRYIFTITRPGETDITKETTLTGTDVAAVPGENCLEITVATQAGRESSPVTSCVGVG